MSRILTLLRPLNLLIADIAFHLHLAVPERYTGSWWSAGENHTYISKSGMFTLLCNQNSYRHPEASGRPSFDSLVSKLSQPENQLLKWTDKDKSVTHPQSTMLGAPLEAASSLHSDLQQQYCKRTLE